jgi:hypothetical protein
VAQLKYEHIQQEACEANLQLPKLGLVLFTFGNVSAVDRALAVFAINQRIEADLFAIVFAPISFCNSCFSCLRRIGGFYYISSS